MKIDLVYPKIPENSDKFHGKCIAFEKYDGTNMHWNWSCKGGWGSFGTRRTEFFLDQLGISEFMIAHPELSKSVYLFNDRMRDELTMFLCKNKPYSTSCHVTLFTEFYGPNSFAGGHSDQDAFDGTQTLVAFDLSVDNKLLPPEKFLEDFEDVDIDLARVVYSGKYSGQFAEDIRKGKYDVNEGVVVKGVVEKEVFMTKVKTNDYLRRLKNR